MRGGRHGYGNFALTMPKSYRIRVAWFCLTWVWLFWSDRADGTAAIWAMVSLMRQAYSRVGCDRRVGAVMWKGSW
jgi:hypothetical protein